MSAIDDNLETGKPCSVESVDSEAGNSILSVLSSSSDMLGELLQWFKRVSFLRDGVRES